MLCILPALAHATFPGKNGKIAFGTSTADDIWVDEP